MNKKIVTASVTSFALGAALFIGLSGTLAANSEGFRKGPGFEPEKKLAIEQALEAGDYQAWKEAMGENKMTEVINEENFSKFAEVQKMIRDRSGSVDEIKSAMSELGIEQGFQGGVRMMKRDRLTEEQRVALESAFQSGDYNAWKAIEANGPMAEKINEGNFARFSEAHRLMKSGDLDGAKAIFEELGIEKGGFGEPGEKGFRGGMRSGEKPGKKMQSES